MKRMRMSANLVQGNAMSIPLADESVHCVVTSPPYWGLRDYGTARWVGGDPECDHGAARLKNRFDYPLQEGNSVYQGTNRGSAVNRYMKICPACGSTKVDNQLGLESNPELYVENMVSVFREVWRVLRDDGTLWLNLGDSYATSPGKGSNVPQTKWKSNSYPDEAAHRSRDIPGLKPKDLVGIPWRVALALQADGWYLRSDIIWSKPNPMPESVTDRPTKAHEYLFLLAKSSRYFYDNDAVRENVTDSTIQRLTQPNLDNQSGSFRVPGKTNGPMKAVGQAYSFKRKVNEEPPPGQSNQHRLDRDDVQYRGTRNRRTVWEIATQPYSGAHFATFPPALVEPCIMAGTSEYGVCANCGTPWERIVERGNAVPRPDNPNPALLYSAGSGHTHGSGKTTLHKMRSATTLGWRPGCDCGAETVPAVVFDPFGGSGTTAQVARALGRVGIAMDLNGTYLGLARERLELDRLAAWKDGSAVQADNILDELPLFQPR